MKGDGARHTKGVSGSQALRRSHWQNLLSLRKGPNSRKVHIGKPGGQAIGKGEVQNKQGGNILRRWATCECKTTVKKRILSKGGRGSKKIQEVADAERPRTLVRGRSILIKKLIPLGGKKTDIPMRERRKEKARKKKVNELGVNLRIVLEGQGTGNI